MWSNFKSLYFYIKVQGLLFKVNVLIILRFVCSFSDFFHSMLANSDKKFKALKMLVFDVHSP